MGGMSCAEVSLVPWRILKNAVNNCVSVSDKYVPQTLTMLAKKKFSDKKNNCRGMFYPWCNKCNLLL